jgi:hypothetical protein
VAKSSKKPAHANIAVGSLAYDTLVQNLNDRRMRKIWRDDIAQIDEDIVFTPGKAHTVQVTSRIGQDIIETLRPFISEAASSFLDIESLMVVANRSDGHKSFDKPVGIAGQLIGSNALDTPKLNNDRMQINSHFAIKAEFSFILF